MPVTHPHPRRYQEVLRQAAAHQALTGSASICLGARNAVAGTGLAPPFPAAAKLVAAGYACVEDLPEHGFDPAEDARAEIERIDGLDEKETTAVLAARGFTT